MVTDAQVRRLMKLIRTEKTLAVAAAKAGMDEMTARKYRDAGRLLTAYFNVRNAVGQIPGYPRSLRRWICRGWSRRLPKG